MGEPGRGVKQSFRRRWAAVVRPLRQAVGERFRVRQVAVSHRAATATAPRGRTATSQGHARHSWEWVARSLRTSAASLRVGCVLALTVLAAACGTADPDSPADPTELGRSAGPNPSATRTASTTPSPSEAVTETPAAPSSTPPTPTASAIAADGKNYQACEDGTCEVAISDFPVSFPVGFAGGQGVFTFDERFETGVGFDLSMPGLPVIGGSVTDAIDCYLGGSGLQCSPAPLPEPEPGQILVRLSALTDDVAVVRLVAG